MSLELYSKGEDLLYKDKSSISGCTRPFICEQMITVQVDNSSIEAHLETQQQGRDVHSRINNTANKKHCRDVTSREYFRMGHGASSSLLQGES